MMMNDDDDGVNGKKMQTQEGCHVGRDEFTQILFQSLSLSLFSGAKLDVCLCILHTCS